MDSCLHAAPPYLHDPLHDQFEPDCPGYPTEWYTVDVNGVQVADLTADEAQSLAISHMNGSVTLSLPLNQRLSESAVAVNMTKFNTVPTNRSDNMGNIVTEMVIWETSAVFGELVMNADYTYIIWEVHIIYILYVCIHNWTCIHWKYVHDL